MLGHSTEGHMSAFQWACYWKLCQPSRKKAHEEKLAMTCFEGRTVKDSEWRRTDSFVYSAQNM